MSPSSQTSPASTFSIATNDGEDASSRAAIPVRFDRARAVTSVARNRISVVASLPTVVLESVAAIRRGAGRREARSRWAEGLAGIDLATFPTVWRAGETSFDEETVRPATVARFIVSVVTHFTWLGGAVATDDGACAAIFVALVIGFDHAKPRTAIAWSAIAVVALFAVDVDFSVPTARTRGFIIEFAVGGWHRTQAGIAFFAIAATGAAIPIAISDGDGSVIVAITIANLVVSVPVAPDRHVIPVAIPVRASACCGQAGQKE